MKALYLPALTGKFGEWRYYQVVMKVRDILYKTDATYRVNTVEEVDVVYSKEGVSKLLQRVLDERRLQPIKQFLLSQPDKYINNLTVAIFGGQPDWISVDIEAFGYTEGMNEDELTGIEKTIGFIKLTGEEILFVLDGQHRLKGLREAVKADLSLLDYSIAVTLIIHMNDEKGIRRTRRLFSTINRHAKPVSEGENILLDEDDLSAIIARKIIEENPFFKGKDLVALNKTANLKSSDIDKLTSIISLWNINELLIDSKKVYPNYEGSKKDVVKIRPTDEVIQINAEQIFGFWETYFEIFKEVYAFIENRFSIDYRRHGGPFYLRPIGQELFAVVYKALIDAKRVEDIKKFAEIEEDIRSEFWLYVLWDPFKGNYGRVINSKSYARDYLFYHFSIPMDSRRVIRLKQKYIQYSANTKRDLPPRLLQLSR